MVTALALVAKDGGDPDSIRVELPIAAQLAALDAGRIDAILLRRYRNRRFDRNTASS